MAGGETLKRIAVLLARLLVGGVFVYAGWLKAAEPGVFIRDIWNFQLVPEDWAYWLAAYLPYLEIIVGLALVTGMQRCGAHVVLGVMLTVFLVALVSAAARDLDVNCGCFGGSAEEASAASLTWAIIRDLLLFAGLAVSILAARPAGRGALAPEGAES